MEEKICVFDLDGTLWKENSHVDIIHKYMNKGKIGKIIERMYAFFLPKLYMNYLSKMYNKIPVDYIYKYTPQFRKSAIEILNKKCSEGYKVICISNAPEEIVKEAGRRLNIESYKAPVGKKELILKEKHPVWKRLVVITDNVSDESIIKLADEVYIFSNKVRKKIFEKMELEGSVCYLDADEE